ncbi:MAG: hypothetical protein KIT72_16685 [Polyangiaceae bacterium]|nr:hypothetical protein [Polyangiaceae bacterium]
MKQQNQSTLEILTAPFAHQRRHRWDRASAWLSRVLGGVLLVTLGGVGARATNGLKPWHLCCSKGIEVGGLQILNGAGASQIEEVGPRPVVASSTTLPLGDVSEAVLYDNALAQTAAPFGRGNQLPEPVLEAFILCDAHGSPG